MGVRMLELDVHYVAGALRIAREYNLMTTGKGGSLGTHQGTKVPWWMRTE